MNSKNDNSMLDTCCAISCCDDVKPEEKWQEHATTPEASCCASTCCNDTSNTEEKAAEESIRTAVREQYDAVAKAQESALSSCCSSCHLDPEMSEVNRSSEVVSQELGYSEADVNTVPTGSNMGLGCGNPQAIAALMIGETVLDLGSGGGFDCFLAAAAVGKTGSVIGVDMTPAMLTKARTNLDKTAFRNIDFRLGEIENLPVVDESVDVIISNCVVNLSPNKKQVFLDSYRVLKPGGRLAISDVVATGDISDEMKNDMALFTACMSGASAIGEIETWLEQAGFDSIVIRSIDESIQFIKNWAADSQTEGLFVSATIEAIKPIS